MLSPKDLLPVFILIVCVSFTLSLDTIIFMCRAWELVQWQSSSLLEHRQDIWHDVSYKADMLSIFKQMILWWLDIL